MAKDAWSAEWSTTSEISAERGRNRTVHDWKQKPDQHHEEVDHIDTMKIIN